MRTSECGTVNVIGTHKNLESRPELENMSGKHRIKAVGDKISVANRENQTIRRWLCLQTAARES